MTALVMASSLHGSRIWPMAKLLGIDVGTSGAKAVLIDESGAVLAQASSGYPISTPRPLWSEQYPEDWWQGVLRCVAAIGEPRPDAIGLSGQMHGAVFLDGEGVVIRPAILWNDQRTAAECDEIDRAVGPEKLRQITGNPPLTGFQAPKILWLRNHELSNYGRIKRVLLPKDYIRFRMSGVPATDVSDASGTGLFDVSRRVWSNEILDRLELDEAWFPPASESWISSSSTSACPGLDEGIPIVGGAGDQAASAVGTGAVAPGIVSVSLGTSGVVFTSLDKPHSDPSEAAHTFCHANGGWHCMGVMLSCGGSLRWFRDTFHGGRSYDDLAALAKTAPSGSDGLTFLPYLTGERSPHNDPEARAAFAGLTASHAAGHVARAVFEGVTFGLAECFELLKSFGASGDSIRVTGGGAKSAFWLQMLTDVFQAPCSTVAVDEGPAYGAAILAGVGIGVWPDVVEACRATFQTRGTVEPGATNYAPARRRYAALYPALRHWNRS